MRRAGGGRSRTRRTIYLLILCAAAVVVGGGVWSVTTPVGPGAPRLVTVTEGQSVREVARMLQEMGLVRSAAALEAAAYVTGKWRRIQAGRHELDPGMRGLDILDALCRGSRRAWHWVTIPEGWTLRQIAEKMEEEKLGSPAEFLTEARRGQTFGVSFPLGSDSLEGYLFPDTYRIEGSENVRGIIAQMLRRFDGVVWKGLFEGKPAYGGRSLRELIILASLVEAEAKRNEERGVIAGVLVNRLRLGKRLECDATVQYALGERRKARLTYEDLLVESEYNTYLHPGLPPGPICNPGETSIRAAMKPAEVPYLYYEARRDGSHVFSRTFAEHQAAIARVRDEGSSRGAER